MKNLAGNNVSIFLFRFELLGEAIDFCLNEGISEDMYPNVDVQLKSLVHACCETLLRYKHLSVSNTIMDGNLLASGEFEVMLSKGLGKHFLEDEKQHLFNDAKKISDLLITIMNRRTRGEKEEQHPVSQALKPSDSNKIKKGLEQLGREKHLQSEIQWISEGKQLSPGLKQLRPEDLPPDVTASRGYDHRGTCYIFEHTSLGTLGKIVLISQNEKNTLIQAELCTEQKSSPKEEIFQKVVATINACFERPESYVYHR